MLLNALVHRSYMGSSIQMRVYDSKLSIWNEGLLPSGLSLEDLKTEHNSRPRNPVIANACFLGGYIDTWGRGTLKIINSCKDAGLPEPVIKEMNGGVEVALFEKIEESTGKEMPDSPSKLGNQLGNQLGETKKRILMEMKNNPGITGQKLSEILDISLTAVEKNIKQLRETGSIERIGGTRGYWKVLDD